MALISLFSALAAVSYVAVGLYALQKSPRETLNRVFSLLAFIFFLASLGTYLFYHAEDSGQAWRRYSFFSFSWFVFPPLLLHFVLLLTKRTVPRWFVLVYLPGFFLWGVSLSGPLIISEFVRVPLGWKTVYNRSSFWYYLNVLHYTSLPLLALGFLLKWRKRLTSLREKKQLRVILASFLFSFVLGTFFSTLLPLMGIGDLPPMGSTLILFWIVGIGYAIGKYRLLSLTPEIAAEELISKVEDLIFLVSPRGVVLKANTAAAGLLGYAVRKMEGKSLSDFLEDGTELPPGEVQNIRITLKTFMGNKIPFLASKAGIRDDAGETIGFVFAGTDLRLTQELEDEMKRRGRITDELQASEEKFQKAFLLSPVGIAINSFSRGEFLEVNEVFLELIGWTRREIIGKTEKEIGLWAMSKESKIAALRALVIKKRFRNLEAVIKDRDGKLHTILLSVEIVRLRGRRCTLATVVDITEKKILEKELHRIQRFESLAVLAGGLAHDFNNLLMVILGSLSLGKLYADPENERLIESLEDSERACYRARDLTLRLLALAKGMKASKQRVDVLPLLRDSAALHSGGSRHVTEILSAGEGLVVFADELQLGQVFSNLILNAYQAMTNGGKLLITVEKTDVGKNTVFPGEGPFRLRPGPYILISFKDEGCGIPREIVQNIFDPYFSTKAKGTGLGLSIVFSVLTGHGGGIFIRSEAGKGSEFSVYLPAEGAGISAPSRAAEEVPSDGAA